jgi:hypothetical protein
MVHGWDYLSSVYYLYLFNCKPKLRNTMEEEIEEAVASVVLTGRTRSR